MKTIEKESGLLTAADVIARVRPYVEKMGFDDIRFVLDASDIKFLYNDWEIAIRPNYLIEPFYRYQEASRALAETVWQNEGIKIFPIVGRSLIKLSDEEYFKRAGLAPVEPVPIRDDWTAEEVAARIRPYIENLTIEGLTFQLSEVPLTIIHDYWQVYLRSSGEFPLGFRYSEPISNLMDEIREREGIRVIIRVIRDPENLPPLP